MRLVLEAIAKASNASRLPGGEGSAAFWLASLFSGRSSGRWVALVIVTRRSLSSVCHEATQERGCRSSCCIQKRRTADECHCGVSVTDNALRNTKLDVVSWLSSKANGVSLGLSGADVGNVEDK